MGQKPCYVLFPVNVWRWEGAEIALYCLLRTTIVLCNGLFCSVSPSFFPAGLKQIHALSIQGNYELRIDLEDFENSTAYAQYGTFGVGLFSVDPDDDGYPLTVGDYSGNAGMYSVIFLDFACKMLCPYTRISICYFCYCTFSSFNLTASGGWNLQPISSTCCT